MTAAEAILSLFLFYFVSINLIAFTLMGIDKKRAVKNKFRIPERTLFFVAFIGGAAGGLLGMKYFRHKTKHKKFTAGFPIILILWAAAAYLLLPRLSFLF